MTTGCTVIKDRFAHIHARPLPSGELTSAVLRAEARELAEDVGVEPGEHYTAGITAQRDPGAARLLDGVDYADGGISWEDEATQL